MNIEANSSSKKYKRNLQNGLKYTDSAILKKQLSMKKMNNKSPKNCKENFSEDKNKISNLIKFFDLYYLTPIFYFNRKKALKTRFGGFCSLILIICYLVFIIVLFCELNSKSDTHVVENSFKEINPPLIDFTLNYKKIDEKKKPLFYFAFKFSLDNKKLDYENIKKFIINEFYLTKFTIENGKSEILKILNLIHCSELFHDSYDDLESLKNLKVFQELYCIDTNDNIFVQGDYISENYVYFSAKFKKCQSSKNSEILQNCEKDESLIMSFLKRFSIELFYTDAYFVENIHESYPISYNLVSKIVKPTINFYQKFDLYLSLNTYTSKDNIYSILRNDFNNGNFISINNIERNQASPSNSYISFFFRSSNKKKIYNRSYRTFFNFFAQIGGIGKFLMIIGTFLVVPSNKYLMLMKLANNIMTIISPEFAADFRQETYEAYLAKGTLEYPNPVISANNKSKLESELFIDTFKYEKNSGFNISYNSIFCGIIKKYFKKFYFFLLFEKKNKSADNKKLNFDIPKRNDEKVNNENCNNKEFEIEDDTKTHQIDQYEENMNKKLLEKLLIRKTLDKLDIIKILKFCIEKNSLLKIFNKNQKILFYLNKKVEIQFKNILSILNKNNKKFRNYYNRDFIRREIIFLKALRYARNKPIFDHNIDKRLIERFNFNRELIIEYFGARKIFY